MSSDPIADMLTSIRNSGLSGKKSALVPLSKAKLAVLEVLKKNEYIEDFVVENRTINITLKYYGKVHVITGIKRISSPGRRVYGRKQTVPSTFSGKGLTIVSTSKGILTDKEAKIMKVGGEVICKVW